MAVNRKRFGLDNTYDVVQARQYARQMARELGFGLSDQARIATAVSEVIQQVIGHNGGGEAFFSTLSDGARQGLECICTGGAALAQLLDAASSRLPGGIWRLVDEFVLEHGDGEELAIVMRKWLA
jgi:serine/threonine-protein kinase RsbT